MKADLQSSRTSGRNEICSAHGSARLAVTARRNPGAGDDEGIARRDREAHPKLNEHGQPGTGLLT